MTGAIDVSLTLTNAQINDTGSEYFAMARAAQERLVATWQPGADAGGLQALWHARLDSYCWENQAAGLRTNSAAGSRLGLLGRWYEGIGLTRTDPPQPAAAAAAFEEVIGWGFAPASAKDQRWRDALVLGATRWRVHLALRAGDWKKALELIETVERSQVAEEEKTRFLRDHASVVAWAEAAK